MAASASLMGVKARAKAAAAAIICMLVIFKLSFSVLLSFLVLALVSSWFIASLFSVNFLFSSFSVIMVFCASNSDDDDSKSLLCSVVDIMIGGGREGMCLAALLCID